MPDNTDEAALRLAISERPDSMAARSRLAVLLNESGHTAEALEVLREGTMFCGGRADRLEELSNAFEAIDSLPDALECLQAARRFDPQDTRLREKLEALKRQLQDPETATRQLFNQYAGGFEAHLADLHYTAPEQIALMLQPYADRFQKGRIVDLGCGTGLMAPHLRGWAAELVGVDLSPAMLEEARAKQIYDDLVAGDIVAYCRTPQAQAALVTAADVLVYIGDLGPLFTAVAALLIQGGLFAFTVEQGKDGFQVNEAKRVSHSEDYLRRTAHASGLHVLICKAITPRYDRGKPVKGFMLLLERLA